jgi:hypothetical protein
MTVPTAIRRGLLSFGCDPHKSFVNSTVSKSSPAIRLGIVWLADFLKRSLNLNDILVRRDHDSGAIASPGVRCITQTQRRSKPHRLNNGRES